MRIDEQPTPPERRARRGRPHPSPRRFDRTIGAVAVALTGVVLLAAGCGGGSAPGVASLGSTTTTVAASPAASSGSSGSDAAALLTFTRCMQTHGVPEYPEPGGDPETKDRALAKLEPMSPRFQSAQKACEQAMPKGAPVSAAEREKVLNQALKFAHCMQTHGMANWPDPSAHGYMVAPVGAAAQSPTYLKAARICRPLLPSG